MNGAVDTIGDLNLVNVEQLRVSLLEEWLSAGSGDMTVDLEQVCFLTCNIDASYKFLTP